MEKRGLILSCLLAGLLASTTARANPQGAQVIHGQVNFAQPDPYTLNITNSPNAIINWQQFSIHQNEVTRILQQSSSSAILNRVTGQDPSSLLGQLLSNGKVYLINSNGIIFGQDAVINTAGFIASTLNMSNEDFLEGTLRFEGPPESGVIKNQGYIKAGENGNIYLIAPNIENSGIIETDGGEIILAAGEKITIASLDHEHIVFDVQAPDNEVVNLGQVLTHGGAARMFAGTIKHSGEINANSIEMDAEGRIQLFAKSDIEITADAVITANGINGGTVEIKSDTSTTWVSGTVEAKGLKGVGGDVKVLGERVALFDGATVDASGEIGGGEVLIGGDFQGGNPEVKNAQQTFISEDSEIKADAITEGDGGKVIIWSDETTTFAGNISATGGELSGDGGFAEVSGKEHLQITGHADLTAPNGDYGTLLLDPGTVTIQDGVGTNTGPDSFDDAYIITQLGLGNLTISTSAANFGNERIVIAGDTNITWSQATTLQLDAGQSILVNVGGAVISNTNVSTGFDAIIMNAHQGTPVSGTFVGIDMIDATLSTVGGNIILTGKGGDAFGSNHGVQLRLGTQVTSTDGAITIDGTGDGGDSQTSNHGVFITDTSTLVHSDTGEITITGAGGVSGGSNNIGIAITAGGQITTTSGGITLTGFGPDDISSNYGVFMSGTDTLISSDDGQINITGVGGDGTGSSNYGIIMNSAARVLSTNSGNITLDGTGGAGTTLNHGIFISGVGAATTNSNVTSIESFDGNILLMGLGGGNGTNSDNYGVFFQNAAKALSTGIGSITIDGTGGDGVNNNYAVYLNGMGSITTPDIVTKVEASGGGEISITGTSGNVTGASNYGIFLFNAAQVVNTDTGNITLSGIGGNGNANNYGIHMFGVGSSTDTSLDRVTQVKANGGVVTIDGTGGDGSSINNYGVLLQNASQIINSASGDISIIGSGGAGTSNNNGVFVVGAGVATTSNNVTAIQTVNGDITITGVGGSDGTDSDNRGVYLNNAAKVLSLGNGSITIDGTGGPGVLRNHGVRLDGLGTNTTVDAVTKIEASGSGDTVIIGTGGGTVSGSTNYGIYFFNAAQVLNTGTGGITLNGTGGVGTSNNYGINLQGLGASTTPVAITKIETSDGFINMTGIGGGTTSANDGVLLFNASQVLAGGSGNITINGTGGNGTFANRGVVLFGIGISTDIANDRVTKIESVNGTINITGTGGNSTLFNNYGVLLDDAAHILATGAGNITLNGTGGAGTTDNFGVILIGMGADTTADIVTKIEANSGLIDITGIGDGTGINNYGVYLTEAATLSSVGAGSITIDGTSSMIGTNADGIFTDSTTLNNVIGGASANGDIILIPSGGTADQFTLTNLDIETTGDLIISPANASDTIGVGNGSSGTYVFNDALISEIEAAASVNNITFGRADGSGNFDIQATTISEVTRLLSDSGDINVNGSINYTAASAPLTFTTTSGTITLGADITATGGVLVESGTVSLGATPGTVTITGDFELGSSAILDVLIGGTNQGVDYDWLDIIGTATLDGTLNATLFGGFNPTNGDNFQIITATNGVSGTFAATNLPSNFSTQYNTNDVVLAFILGGCAGTICFDNDSGDFLWTDPLNWDTDSLPGASDDVVIDLGGGITVILNSGSQSIGSLTLPVDNNLSISGGTLDIADPSILNGDLAISTGSTLTGSGDITLNGAFDWSGGLVSGAGLLTTTGTSTLSTTDSKALLGRTWNNTGTVDLADGNLNLSGSILNNQFGGIFNISSTNTVAQPIGNGIGTFNNAGTFNQDSAINNKSISPNVTFNNSGTVNVNHTRLALMGDGTDTGLYDIDTNTFLQISGTRVLDTGSNVTGLGGVLIVAGDLTVNGQYDISTTGVTTSVLSGSVASFNVPLTFNILFFNNGTLDGTGDIVINGSPNFINATLSGTGLLTTNGSIELLGSVTLDERTWNNNGTVAIGNSVLNLDSSAVFNNQGSVTIFPSALLNSASISGSSGTFNNMGNLSFSSAITQTQTIGNADVIFNNSNTGSIFVSSNGTLQMNNFASGTNAGLIRINGVNAGLSTNGDALINSGTISGVGTLDLGGATLTNNGTISPGLSPGKLTIDGDLALSGTSIIDVELGGTNQGVDYDWLDVTGSVTLDGTLNATLFGGFNPTNGDSFQIITAAGGVSGTFAATNLPADFNTQINANDVILEFITALLNIWDGGAESFDWEDALNWSLDIIPTSDHNVEINTGGITITHSSGSDIINSLVLDSTSTLNVTGGSITINDDSTIDGTLSIANSSVTLNGLTSLDSLTLSDGGILLGTGDITVTDTFLINSSSVTSQIFGSDTSKFITQGNTTVSGFLRLNDRDWDNSGTMTITSGTVTLVNNTTVFSNKSGGTVDIQATGTSNSFTSSGTVGIFNNEGTVQKTTDTGTQFINTVFNNTGLVDVQNGILRFSLGGGGVSPGDFMVSSGAALSFTVGTFDLTDADISGSGTVQIIGGSVTLADTAVAGGSFDQNLDLFINSSGILNLDTGSTVTVNDLTITTGTIQGTDDLVVAGDFTINDTSSISGTDGSTLTTFGTSRLPLAGSAIFTLTDRDWINFGTLNFPSTSTLNLSTSNTNLLNEFGSVVDLQVTGPATSITGSGTFINEGTLQRTGTGTSTIDSNLNLLSSGTLLGAGDILLNGAFNWTGGTISGSGLLTTGAITTISGVNAKTISRTWDNNGTINADAFFTISGLLNNAGIFNKNSSGIFNTSMALLNNTGTLNVNTDTLRFDTGGTNSGDFFVAGGATLSFRNGVYGLTDADFSGAGNFFSELGSVITLADTAAPGGSFSSNLNMGIVGTVNSNLGNLVMNNLFLGGTGVLTGAGKITVNGAFNWMSGTVSGSGVFKTNGTSTVSTATAKFLTGRTWNNFGVVNMNGGTLNLSSAIFINQPGSIFNITATNVTTTLFNNNTGSFNNAGIFNMNFAGTRTINNMAAFTNTGKINVNAGKLHIMNTPFSQSGILSITTGATFQTSGGFTNNGTIMGKGIIDAGGLLTNSGTILPGTSPGTLTILGNYTQGAAGILNIELGGLTQGTQYDFLDITGTATLGGTLNVALCNTTLCPSIGTFTPSNGNTFNFISANSLSGNFNSFILPSGFSTNLQSSMYQLIFNAISPTPTPTFTENAITTNEVLVLEENQDPLLATTYFFPLYVTEPDDTFTVPMLVNHNGELLYGYYDENGTAIVVGTNGDTTGPNGETLTLIPADEYNQPLTQTQLFGSISLLGNDSLFNQLVNESGELLFGYYDENGVAIIVGTDPNATGPDGELLIRLSADENNQPLTLTRILNEIITGEGKKVPLVCQ